MDDPMAGTALPGPSQSMRAPVRAPGCPTATPADHAAQQMQTGGARQPVPAVVAPEPGVTHTDEAKRSTVDAAVPVFMRDFPDFSEEDCRAALEYCYRVDITIQMLIEAAFEHLVAKLTGALEEQQLPDPQQPQQNAAAQPDPNDEEEAFRQETLQMRQAMHMSEVDNAVHRKSHEKPTYQWGIQDFQEHFPRSAILTEIAKHCRGDGIAGMCTKESSCELEKLLKNEQHSQRWYKTERGLHGYWMTYATEIVRVATGLVATGGPCRTKGTDTGPRKCRTPNRKRRLRSIDSTEPRTRPPLRPPTAAEATPAPHKKPKTSKNLPTEPKQNESCRTSQRRSRSRSRSRSMTPAPVVDNNHNNNNNSHDDHNNNVNGTAAPPTPSAAKAQQPQSNTNSLAGGECASPPPVGAAADAAAADPPPTRRSKRIRARTDSVGPSRDCSEEPGGAAAAAAAAPTERSSRGSTPRPGAESKTRDRQGDGVSGVPGGVGGVSGGVPLCTTAAAGGVIASTRSPSAAAAAAVHKCPQHNCAQQGDAHKASEKEAGARTGACGTEGVHGGNENGRHCQSADGACAAQACVPDSKEKSSTGAGHRAATQGVAPGHERTVQEEPGTDRRPAEQREVKSRQQVIAELVEELQRLNQRFEKEVVAVAAGPEKLAAFVPFRPTGAKEEEWDGVKIRRSKEGAVQIEIDD